MVIASPGKRDSHHMLVMTALPSETMTPQAGAPGSNPMPKKLRPASNKMTCPTKILDTTIRVLTVLGNMWRHRIFGVLTPVILA